MMSSKNQIILRKDKKIINLNKEIWKKIKINLTWIINKSIILNDFLLKNFFLYEKKIFLFIWIFFW
jgi:hypothetical protein